MTTPSASGVFNIGDSDALGELEWAQRITAVAGWSGELVTLPDAEIPIHLRLPGNVAQHWIADTSRSRAELALPDPVPRDEAIGRTLAWERATPVGFVTHRFDYPAEDAALAGRR